MPASWHSAMWLQWVEEKPGKSYWPIEGCMSQDAQPSGCLQGPVLPWVSSPLSSPLTREVGEAWPASEGS